MSHFLSPIYNNGKKSKNVTKEFLKNKKVCAYVLMVKHRLLII